MRFTTNGRIIVDNQTGLMWDKSTLQKPMSYRAAMAMVDELNAAAYKGYTDWHVPTIHELQSIVDFTRDYPACDPIFEAKPSAYWSSTTLSSNQFSAWIVDFDYGNTYARDKDGDSFIRLVRTVKIKSNTVDGLVVE